MKLTSILAFFSIAIVCCLLPKQVQAQSSSRTSYFMKTSYARTSLNAAHRPDQSYIGIPLLSNIYFDAHTNTFTLEKLTFPHNGERVTFAHPSIPNDMAMRNFSDNNYLVGTLGISFLSTGFYRGDSYWNFNISARLDADANIPKSAFELLKLGFLERGTTTYDLSDISFTNKDYIELAATHSKVFLNNNLTVGATGKLLFGISYVDLDAHKLSLTASNEYWKGQSQVRIRAAGPGIKAHYSESDYVLGRQNFDGFRYSGGSISGYGLGFDVGAVYDLKDASVNLLKPLKVSYALNDIGFIAWSKQNVVQLSSQATEIVVTPRNHRIINGRESINDLFNRAVDDIRQAINLHEDPSLGGYTTSLRVNMNIGLEYEVWKDKMTAGILFSNRFGQYFTTHEFTFSANYMPKNWLATSLSYSTAYSSFDTFGLAVHIAPQRGLNFFLASDYTVFRVSPQWLPTSTKALNLQLGLSVPFGGKR